MTIKVLPNDLQSSLHRSWLKWRLGDDYDPDSDKLLDNIVGWDKKLIEPVFNRVGWYFNGKVSWYEWKLPSGRMLATEEDSSEMFKYTMKLKNAAEKLPSKEEIEAVKLLVRNGRMKTPDWYQFGLEVLHHRAMKLDMSRRLLDFRKKVKNA